MAKLGERSPPELIWTSVPLFATLPPRFGSNANGHRSARRARSCLSPVGNIHETVPNHDEEDSEMPFYRFNPRRIRLRKSVGVPRLVAESLRIEREAEDHDLSHQSNAKKAVGMDETHDRHEKLLQQDRREAWPEEADSRSVRPPSSIRIRESSRRRKSKQSRGSIGPNQKSPNANEASATG